MPRFPRRFFRLLCLTTPSAASRDSRCIGAGYVGGPTMAPIAQKCPHISVTVVDISQPEHRRVEQPLLHAHHDPGLDERSSRAREEEDLFFTTDVEGAIAGAT